MAADDSDSGAHSPRLDCDVCRRDVLRGIGAAGATAALAGTASARNRTGNYSVPESEYLAATQQFGYGMGTLAYFSGKAINGIASLAPWGDESSFKEKYEYQQRLEIYRRAYDFEQMEKRALTGVENQANLYSRVAMEDGLLELFNQAEQGASRTDATAAAKQVVSEEWDKILQQMLTHLEQNVLAVRDWYSHLNGLPTDISTDDGSVGYSMIPECPFSGDIEQSEVWREETYTYDTYEQTGREIAGFGISDYENVMPNGFFGALLPGDLTSPSTNGSSGSRSWESNQDAPFWSDEVWPRIQDGFQYPDDQGTYNQPPEADVHVSGTGTGPQPVYMGLRFYPPNPSHFDVNEDMVEDVSDKPNAHVLVMTRYLNVLDTIDSERQNSLDAVDAWANSNYIEMRDNPDQWDRADMVGPAALQDSAANASNPAEAALQLRGMGIPVNNETDVLLEFPEQTDLDGNPIQAPGYLGATNPPADGFPVGEVIDPEQQEGGIFFAHWANDVSTQDSPDSDGTTGNTTDGNTTDGNTTDGNTTDGNTTDGNTTNTSDGGLDGEQADDTGTYSELVQPFKIVTTADGSDTLTMNARDVSTPDYDWQQVVENLEDLNAAQEDARNQTITVINEGGGGGPLLPDFDFGGGGSPLAGLAIIGGVIVAAGAAVSNLLPGN
ncbi:hypothetical protein SAMN06269185_1493 [Natronoarchaeum philippinense]|uniref:Envelope protein N-terminal domain-containing protein n=1 Tax=Natronoarchaeum philippinense TaxID=558529 RepID=A0A285NRI9_NATPI|nr:hypothetical protein [Natronoarchaeum philippinense]SNZ12095.1 hypothetical protein SAMN06269185_1493 [Natronoarchaeum philippinense]